MFNTFNMGVGMSLVVPAEDVEKSLEILRAHGEDPYVIGEIVENADSRILLEQAVTELFVIASGREGAAANR